MTSSSRIHCETAVVNFYEGRDIEQEGRRGP